MLVGYQSGSTLEFCYVKSLTVKIGHTRNLAYIVLPAVILKKSSFPVPVKDETIDTPTGSVNNVIRRNIVICDCRVILF